MQCSRQFVACLEALKGRVQALYVPSHHRADFLPDTARPGIVVDPGCL
jgi:hypothetical protein